MQILLSSILVFFLLIPGIVKANADNSIETITVSEGLPNSHISCMMFDNRDLMWIGTSNGLCFYDGYTFITKQSIPFDSLTLADDNILFITQDKNNNIWLLTQYGLEFLEVNSFTNKRVKYIPDNTGIVGLIASKVSNSVYILYTNKIRKFNIDSFKEESFKVSSDFGIEAAVQSVGYIYMLGKTNLLRLNLLNEEIESLSFQNMSGEKNKTIGLNVLNSNLLIFSIGGKLFLYNINSQQLKNIKTFESNIKNISKPVNNKVVVSSQNSIYILNINTDQTLSEVKEIFISKDISINEVQQDDNNIIWAATNIGIIKINPHALNISHNPLSNAGIIQTYIKEIIVESSQKGVLVKISEGKYRFIRKLNATENDIHSIATPTSCLLTDNILYIGTYQGLYLFNLKNGNINSFDIFKGVKINSIKNYNDDIWISSDSGVFLNSGKGFEKICDEKIQKFIVTDSKLYFTSDKGFGEIDTKSCITKLLLNESNSNEFLIILDLMQSYDGKIWLATEDGLYRYNPEGVDQTELFSLVFKGKVYSLIEPEKLPEIWFSSDLGIGAIDYQSGRSLLLGYEDGIRQTNFIAEGAFYGEDGKINFLALNEIIGFVPDSIFRNKKSLNINISYAEFTRDDGIEKKLFLSTDTLIVTSEVRFFRLFFTTFDFFAPLHTLYEYSLTRKADEEKWQEMVKNNLSFGKMKPGTYNLKVRAKNSHGFTSEKHKNLVIIIKASVFQTRTAYLIYIVALFFSVILIIRFRTRHLIRVNREYKEKERIAKKIEQQKEELSLKNKNITDSINYARRIQVAMMPSKRHFKALFPESFILHMPKDIVSGDFFWINHVRNKTFLTAVDCTGHGVPGAFMSIIGVELFRRITEVEKIDTPADILNSLSKNFERVFGDVDEMKLRDGMDLAFCSISEDQSKMEFSGAFNPLYIIRDSSIIEIKADRQSVGVYQDEDEVHSFTNHSIPLQDGDLIYIFTDGYVDQFGGPEGKKYKYRRFRHLLLALHQLPMEKQEEFLKKSILEWKGESDQVDDILVMGLRIHRAQ